MLDGLSKERNIICVCQSHVSERLLGSLLLLGQIWISEFLSKISNLNKFLPKPEDVKKTKNII